MSTYAFQIATTDPETTAKGVIAGREFYARKFTLQEVQSLADEIRNEFEKAVAESRVFNVRDEMRPFVKALNSRIADGKKGLTVDQLMAALTEDDYRQVMRFYAPSLAAPTPDGGAGNA
jgi:hypothetical protein